MTTAFIGFGSNMGDRLDYCDRAITLLGLLPASRVTGVSSLYETEPVADPGDPGSRWFLNGVVRLETDLVPSRLLAVCREIERGLDRGEDRQHGPRTMDLDLLLYGTQVIREPGLEIPHPRLHRRRFVLAPLAELVPDSRHPTLNRTIRELLDALDNPAVVRRLEPAPHSQYGSRHRCGSQPQERPETD